MTFWLKWQLGGCLCHYYTPVLIFSMFMWIWPSDMHLWFPHDHHIITAWVTCSRCDSHRPFMWSSHDSGMMGHMTVTIPTWWSHDHYMSLKWRSHDQHMIPMWRSCDQHMIFTLLLCDVRTLPCYYSAAVLNQMFLNTFQKWPHFLIF